MPRKKKPKADAQAVELPAAEQPKVHPAESSGSTSSEAKESFNWRDTVRGWHSHGDAGVRFITAKVPIGDHGQMDVVGVQFDKGKIRTEQEKREMFDAGFSFDARVEAWVKPNRDDADLQAKDLAQKFGDRRKATAEGQGR